MNGRTVLFAGGGTGGHINPGIAISEALHDRAGHDLVCHFLCSERPVDRVILSETGLPFTAVPAAPFIVRPGFLLRFAVGWRRTRSVVHTICRNCDVCGVVTLGGFVAPPVVAETGSHSISSLLLNLDAIPGKANRWLAKRCDRVLSAVATPENPEFASAIVGMPVRQRARAPVGPAECRQELGLESHIPTLFVTGASQGSASLNDLMMEVLKSAPDLLRGWQVLHLSGAERARDLKARYRDAGVTAVVFPFLHDMGLAWGAASLAISRAGASSVAEAWLNAVPAIFLPYPHHKDRHQHANAAPMVEIGGAIIVDDQTEPGVNLTALLPVLETLLRDMSTLDEMGRALRAHAPDDAAAIVADGIIRLFL